MIAYGKHEKYEELEESWNMQRTLYSLAARGLDADLITIEVDHYAGQPGTVIVGLGDTAVQESRERVRAAIKNSDFSFPRGRVVVNLAPADMKKSGPCFDLPIALGMISLSHELQIPDVSKSLFFGELSLDGSVRHVNGILGLVAVAKEKGFQQVFVPRVNAAEAALIPHVEVYGVDTLEQIVSFFRGESHLERTPLSEISDHSFATPGIDFADIRGQAHAKRALEIAAAGGHNILMNGAPGSGKTLMAKALQGILPKMSLSEALEVTKIYSLAGLLPEKDFLIRIRPFRSVHHTASGAALVGGGRVPKPGEISLAHRGVLFLDEIAEFPPFVIELLRQPLEDRTITISRAHGSVSFPAQFILCGAMNPCPCGFHQVPESHRVCDCSPGSIVRYQSRLSGPFLDRIDLHCTVSPVAYSDLQSGGTSESSARILERVETTRSFQGERFQGTPLRVNAEMSPKDIYRFCLISSPVRSLLEKALRRLHLSARSYHRVLKVARTIADLAGESEIGEGHVLEALQYRRMNDQ